MIEVFYILGAIMLAAITTLVVASTIYALIFMYVLIRNFVREEL